MPLTSLPRLTCSLGIFLFLGALGHALGDQTMTPPSPVQTDPKIEVRVEGLLGQMTLEEKVSILAGADYMHTQGVPRLGIPVLKFSDGPSGVRCWGPSTAYPNTVVVAATWDRDAALAMGRSLGRDARARGVNVLLGPGANIYREAQCGRNFEYLGEDPMLASEMAVNYVRGVQGQGVAACIKHYVCNEQEIERGSMNMIVSQRALQEIYLPPFLAAIRDGGVWSVMAAYNKVNGEWCTENKHLLTGILRDQWHYQGVLMSDWNATHNTLEPLQAGLGLEMAMPDRNAFYYNMGKIEPLLTGAQVTPAVIDDHVRCLLRLIVSMGFMDRTQTDSSIPLNDPQSADTALRIASEGMVLLKNKENLLPLHREKIRRIVVLGPNASPGVIGGGGSGATQPFSFVSVVDALKTVAGPNVEVRYIPEAENHLAEKSDFTTLFGDAEVRGISAEYFNNSTLEGTPVARQIDPKIDFNWHESPPLPGITGPAFSVRWQGKLTPDKTGNYVLTASSDDGSRVFLDGKKILDLWSPHSLLTQAVTLPLQQGHSYAVKVEYFNSTGTAEMHFGWGLEGLPDETRKLVSSADAVVYAGGLNAEMEHEASDRPWDIPAEQDFEISQVAAANPHLVVAINAGGNLGMKQSLDRIPALIWAWYPGQNGNLALAKIIFGDINPSGRLPDSFEKQFSDAPAFATYPGNLSNGGTQHLAEDIYVGYRWFDKKAIEPAFPFGFGLSYTTFTFSTPTLFSTGTGENRRLTVWVPITNTGSRDGAEVVQLYVRPPKGALDRPVQELKGFDRVVLKAGETKTVSLTFTRKDFACYDEKSSSWIVPPGTYQVALGRSSRDICGTTTVTW